MKTNLIIFIIAIVIVIGLIAYQITKDNTKENVTQEPETPKLLAGTISPYYEFHPALYSKALAENKIILLYFFADWCPICKKEQTDSTLPTFNELQNSNILGFRIHYNDGKATAEEQELAKQYGITYQHTKVILKDGKQVLKDLNSWNKNKYLEELSKYG